MIGYFFAKHGIKLVVMFSILFAFFYAGWAIKGRLDSGELARKDTQMAQMRLALAEEKARKAEATSMAATAALTQIETAAYLMRSAVDSYNLDQKNVTAKLSGISQELKALKVAAPLPVDCKPDTGRINSFKKSIDATNDAIKR